jgi:hypothetical protein
MKEKIPEPAGAGGAPRSYVAAEAWHLFGIISEFAEATERMNIELNGRIEHRSFEPSPSERETLRDL